MANYFDQFDEAKPSENYFDQFDEKPKADSLGRYKADTTVKPQEGPVQVGEDAPDFTRGFANTLGNLQQTYGGAKVLAGKALGSKELMQSGLQSMKEGEARTEVKATDDLTEAYKKGIGTVLTDWLPYQIGAGAGNIVETLGMMGIGATVGAVTGGGVGALPGAVGGFLEKSLAEKGIQIAAKKILETEGKEAAEAYVAKHAAEALTDIQAKAAARTAAKSIGSNLGLASEAALHGAGEVTQQAVNQAQAEGRDPTDIDLQRVIPAALVHGVADFFTEKIGLHALDGMASNASGSMIKDIAKAIALTGTKELIPEEIQEIAQRYGANMSLADADALKDYLNTAGASYAMSVAPAGIGGVRTHLAGRIPTAPADSNAKGIEDVKQDSQTVDPSLQDPLLHSTVDENGNPVDNPDVVSQETQETKNVGTTTVAGTDRTGTEVPGQQGTTTAGGATTTDTGGLGGVKPFVDLSEAGEGPKRATLEEKVEEQKAGQNLGTEEQKPYLTTQSVYSAQAPGDVDTGINHAGHEQAFDAYDTVDYKNGVLPELKTIAEEKNKQQQEKRDKLAAQMKDNGESPKAIKAALAQIKDFKPGAPLEFMSEQELVDLYDKHSGKTNFDKSEATTRKKDQESRNQFVSTLEPLQQAKVNAVAQRSFADEVIAGERRKKQTTEADQRKNREKKQKDKAFFDVQQQLEEAKTDVAEREKQANEAAEKEASEEKDLEQTAKEVSAAAEKVLPKREKTPPSPKERTVSKRIQNITQAIKDKSLPALLKAVGGTRRGSDPATVQIANIFDNLLATFTTNTKIQFGEVENGAPGKYDPATDTITIQGNDEQGYTGKRALDETVLHEVSHSVLDHVFDNPEAYIKSLPGEKRNEARAALNRLNNNYKKIKAKFGSKYNIDTIKEFAAEFWSNSKFQMDLALMPSESTYAPKDNMFTSIVRTLANVFGVSSKDEAVNFKEVAEDLARLISAPSEGITGKEVSYAKQAEDKLRDEGNIMPTPGEKSDYEVPLEQQPKNVKYFKDLLFTRAGWRRIATKVQNERYEVKHWQDVLDMAGKIYYEGKDKINNIYGQLTLATGRGKNLFNSMVEGHYEALDQSIYNLSKAVGLDISGTLDMMHRVLEGLHDQERRQIKYLMIVPLSEKAVLKQNGKMISPAERRSQIFKLLDTKSLTETQAKQLRNELNIIVKKYTDPLGESPRQVVGEDGKRIGVDTNIDSPIYNVTGLTAEAAKERVRQYEASPHKAQIDEVRKHIKALHHTTTELNKMANYWSQPVTNRVNFYGFDNYVPLEGVAKHGEEDEALDFDSKRMGRELQDVAHSFDGRISVSNNPVLQTMSNATRAAMRAGRKDLTQSIKNSLKKDDKLNPHGQGILSGSVIKHITFEERRDENVLKEIPRENTVFHYNEDGSIDILEIRDPKLREAIRRTYRNNSPLVDVANSVTSKLGMLHTRYNYNFAPLNYVRDTLTNAWAIGAELGPTQSAKFLAQVASKVTQGSLPKAMKVAALYESKDFDQIKALADRDPTIKDMYDFIQQGGMVNYIQGISLKSNFQQLQKEIGRSGVMRNIAQWNKYVDIWTDMFELSSRSAAFAIAKQNFIQHGMDEKAATTKAAEYAKNLANFEQVGEHGKALGAVFMFFRPSATGAVRAIEAAAPAFQKVDDVIRTLPSNLSEQDKATFKQNFLERQKNAQYMLTVLMGLGAMAYTMSMMMAPDDELNRNRVMTDDPAQWTRFARFYSPFGKEPLQLPWGFGLGSFAAGGAQLAMVTTGHQSIGGALNNILTQISLDSFVPIPVSRMNIADNPALWMLDSLTPSMLRPAMEFVVNKNGLGQSIYNDSNRRMGDAYVGGDNIPVIYKNMARYLANATDGAIDWSPNSIYFLANSYADGPARVIESTVNGMYLMSGEKQYKSLTAGAKQTPFIGSFIGAAPNVDSREFTAVEKQIQDLSGKVNMFKTDPVQYAKFLSRNPTAEAVVEVYNKNIGELNKLRQEGKAIRLMQISQADRDVLLDMNKQEQNLVKYNLVQTFKAFGIKP